MPADLIHLVRHGEVHNPDGILYGRIPGFRLSELGHRMADAAAQSLAGHPVTALRASPLERAQQSAQPWSDRFALPITTDERLIEPTNWFEGTTVRRELRKPSSWLRLWNPSTPSWGEPYRSVLARMLSVMDDAWQSADGGEVVMVSHQMPIVTVQRALSGQRMYHNPAKRRCMLSSITTFRRDGERFAEVSYAEPARELAATAVDTGAV